MHILRTQAAEDTKSSCNFVDTKKKGKTAKKVAVPQALLYAVLCCLLPLVLVLVEQVFFWQNVPAQPFSAGEKIRFYVLLRMLRPKHSRRFAQYTVKYTLPDGWLTAPHTTT